MGTCKSTVNKTMTRNSFVLFYEYHFYWLYELHLIQPLMMMSALHLSNWVTSIYVYELTYSLEHTFFSFYFSFEQLSGYILIYLTLMCTNWGQKALNTIPLLIKTYCSYIYILYIYIG